MSTSKFITLNLMIAGLILGFQNCASNVPGGSTEELTQGGNPQVQPPSDDEVSQVILPPTGGTITPDPDPGSIDTRLEGFQAKCSETIGVFNQSDDVSLCTYTFPALRVSGDIARMIWAKSPTNPNSYEPSGRDFRAEIHAELACKQIMGGNNVFPYDAIKIVSGFKDSGYWDFHEGGWQVVNSPDNDDFVYYVLSEISCRFFNQDSPVGNNNIDFD